MFSEQDIDSAVAAGVLTSQAAAALRAHVERERSLPAVDEEYFRLLTGFNDIFVSIAAAILLVAVGWIGQSIGAALGLTVSGADSPSPLAPALVAATAWGLAMFFTARRRMALPSILLLLAFVGGVLTAAGLVLTMAVGPDRLNDNPVGAAIVGAAAAAVAAAAAWLHWRVYKVPITIAAGAAAAAGIIASLTVAVVGDGPALREIMLALTLILGIAMFLFAMSWDGSDPARMTRRSDVAFWLHLLAAPMIVHPVFALMGLTDGRASIGEGLVVIMLYIVLGVIALAVDRRALLVSALAYVLYALSELLRQVGAVGLNVALTALVIGSALLLLSAFWHQARRMVVNRLPGGLVARLPVLDRAPAIAQSAG